MKASKFGTDGIRGVYGDTLTEQTAYALGYALGKRGKVLIGRDNRLSSPALAKSVACGVARGGSDSRSVGLITTPALYYLLTKTDNDFAVMVTASHNPPDHNGLKVFTREGKPSPDERKEIEEGIASAKGAPDDRFSYEETPSLLALYEEFFRQAIGSLHGLTVVVDYAGGAGGVFKGLLGTLGAHVIPLNLRACGDRINVDSGALHPSLCARETHRLGADLGFAIDGDGDRIIAADRTGTLLDGDRITYLLACRKKARGALPHDSVAMTVMTNGGVIKSLNEKGITVRSCAVGDSAVAATMKAEGLALGGEQSGHVILGDLLLTGDAMLVGATLLKSIAEEGPLALTPPPTIYPQVSFDLPVPDKRIAEDPRLRAFAAKIKEELIGGRVLLRASGTEEVVRIMVEHPEEDTARTAAMRLKQKVLSCTQ